MNNVLIGQSDFKQIRESNAYYVDKSLFVEDIMKCPYLVILLTRPRRFGKTINLSLLHHFFEKTDQDKSSLFDGLAIQQSDIYSEHFSKYPVIFLTFKDIKQSNWNDCLEDMKLVISQLFESFDYLLDSDCLTELQANDFKNIKNRTASNVIYGNALKFLSKFLYQYHQQRVVILVDEYDTPIHSGYQYHYYDEIVSFIRNLLSGGLKDNNYLHKGVITGALRVAKESIFTGLNNLGVFTLFEHEFNQCFGFTLDEIRMILTDFGLLSNFDNVLKWYDGYNFGDQKILNPWSVMNYVSNKKKTFKPYWLNTSSMEMLEQITLGKPEAKKKSLRQELTELIQGGYIQKNINENIIMQDIYNRNLDVIWSFLLHSGYLKSIAYIDSEFENIHKLSIPNMEVKIAYRNLVTKWFAETVNTDDLNLMLQALTNGDIALFEKKLKIICLEIMSYHDFAGSPEKVYHALVLGMLVWLSNDYVIRSNRESGYGRYDIIFMPKDKTKQGIIIEFKTIEENDVVEDVINDALKQIETKCYDVELKAAHIHNILKLAIGFSDKSVYLKQGTFENTPGA